MLLKADEMASLI